MTIQFGGLASGLDTNSIISALVALERRPIQLLGAQRATEDRRLSLIGTLEGLVESLQKKAQELSSQGSFFAHSLDAGDDSVASFSITGTPPSGAHQLDVVSLAAADRYTFTAVADPDVDLGAGDLSFDYDGTSYSISFAADASSLNEVAAAINDQAGDDVTATVINVGTEQSPSYQLVLSGDDTGADFTIDNLTSGVAGLAVDSNVVPASNAQITIDGVTVQRSSNLFSDVLEGVSFTVHRTESTSFTVDVDVEGTKANVQDFVDAYNDVIEFINEQNSYDSESGPGGDLFGDSALYSVRRTVSSALFDVDIQTVQNDTEGFSTLGLIGIDLGSDGTLSIDAAKFDEKLNAGLEAVEALFSDSDGGLLVKLDQAIEEITGGGLTPGGDPLEGLFVARRETIKDSIGRIDDQVERLERRVEQVEETLIQRFANLESLLSSLNAQSSFLNSGLAFPSATTQRR